MVGRGVNVAAEVAVAGREVAIAGRDVTVDNWVTVSPGVCSIPIVKVSLQAMRPHDEGRVRVRVFIEPYFWDPRVLWAIVVVQRYKWVTDRLRFRDGMLLICDSGPVRSGNRQMQGEDGSLPETAAQADAAAVAFRNSPVLHAARTQLRGDRQAPRQPGNRSAGEPLLPQPSLRRFGLETTVRPSLAFYNTRAEVDALVQAIRHCRPRPRLSPDENQPRHRGSPGVARRSKGNAKRHGLRSLCPGAAGLLRKVRRPQQAGVRQPSFKARRGAGLRGPAPDSLPGLSR